MTALCYSTARRLIRAFLVVLLILSAQAAPAIELDDIYRLDGDYRVLRSTGLKIYYPARIEAALPRIEASFQAARARLRTWFPDVDNLEVPVILTDHDDRSTENLDQTLDQLTLGLFEETRALSTRGYTLEQRFGMRLANLLINRRLGSAKPAIKRRIGLLVTPAWLIEGLATWMGVGTDCQMPARLGSMCAAGRSIEQDTLDTYFDREGIERDNLRFIARGLINCWIERAGPKAIGEFLAVMGSRPLNFEGAFSRAFGQALTPAVGWGRERLRNQCHAFTAVTSAKPVPLRGFGGGRYWQSFHRLPGGGAVYVSSARYRDEVYDLWRHEPNGRHRTLLRNVHPVIWVDPADGTVLSSCYDMTSHRMRRLSLWAIPPGGKARRLSEEDGSFYPLARADRRYYYLLSRHGVTSLMSIPETGAERGRTEFAWPADERPTDVAVDPAKRRLVFVRHEGDAATLLAVNWADPTSAPMALFAASGTIRAPELLGDGRIAFLTGSLVEPPKLVRLDAANGRLETLARLPGGIWDFSPLSTPGSSVLTTLVDGGFAPVTLECTPLETTNVPAPVANGFRSLPPLRGTAYRPEYRTSYWVPRMDQDAQGTRLGVFSYRADTLDRNRLVVSPTYGLRSHEFGYTANWQMRLDLLRFNLSGYNNTMRRSYRSVSYWEKAHTFDASIGYPLDLATTLTAGLSQSTRRIAKGPDDGVQGPLPTTGRDNATYIVLRRDTRRTEPLTDIFPRKGRTIDAWWRKGLTLGGGEMLYTSYGLRWLEHFPLNRRFVMTLRGVAGEDDKDADLRRPEDLAVGGLDWLRGYPGSVRYGDSMRAASVHVGCPLGLTMTRMHPLVQREMLVAEAFYELGDARSDGRGFDFVRDWGLELRMKILALRRLPLILRWGVAFPLGQPGYDQRTYFAFSTPSLSSLLD